jgi:hypothetical protein
VSKTLKSLSLEVRIVAALSVSYPTVLESLFHQRLPMRGCSVMRWKIAHDPLSIEGKDLSESTNRLCPK